MTRGLGISRWVCGVVFTIAGILHFVIPKRYEEIVPPGFPNPAALVAVSGVAEVLGGVAVTRPSGRWFARWWLIGLLLAVFPANVYMAVDHQRFSQVPSWALWARLPLQPLMIWWVWAVTRRDQKTP